MKQPAIPYTGAHDVPAMRGTLGEAIDQAAKAKANTARTKIGTNHGKPHSRIWIEGARLTASGFHVGTIYTRHVSPGRIELRTRNGHAGEHRYKVSGKGAKPIIDLTGAIVGQVFPPPATHVTVTYSPNVITITA